MASPSPLALLDNIENISSKNEEKEYIGVLTERKNDGKLVPTIHADSDNDENSADFDPFSEQPMSKLAFQCNICNKRYQRKGMLDKHIKKNMH